MSSVSGHGDDDGALATAYIAFQMKELLPGPQRELAVSDGHGNRRSEQGRLQMRVPVTIMPGLLMAILAARRDQLVQDGGKIVLESRLKFDGTDRSRAPDVENVDRAGLDAGGSDNRPNLLAEIVHVSVAFCSDRDLTLIAHDLAP